MEGTLALLIPVLALSIPVAAIFFGGIQKVMRLRIEEERAKHPDPAAASELEALREEVAQLRDELDEVHERLDFTERIVVGRGDQPRLPDRPEKPTLTT